MLMNVQLLRLILAGCLLTLFSSCMVVDATKAVVVTTGKVAYGTVKTTGKVAYHTAKATGQGVKYLAGSRRVELEREGNSFYLWAVLNGRHKVRLLLDTGASDVQIPMSLALKMGVDSGKTEVVRATIADGSVVEGRAFQLKTLSTGGASARNVRAMVLRGKGEVGLLGMSYLDHFIFKIDTDACLLYLKEK